MRRFKTLLLLVVLLGATPCAFAQFSISKVTPEQVEIKVTEDSSKKKIVNLDNNFYSRARYKAERRAIRQERNTLQINASAMFNQTGFTNWYAGGDNVFSTSLAFYFSHKYLTCKPLSMPATVSTVSTKRTLKMKMLSSSTSVVLGK